MLADPAYCNLVQNIGVASLGADEKQIWHLTKLYWFTVEFGVVREGDQVKGFGAGVLSSYGELQHMASGRRPCIAWNGLLAPICRQQCNGLLLCSDCRHCRSCYAAAVC